MILRLSRNTKGQLQNPQRQSWCLWSLIKPDLLMFYPFQHKLISNCILCNFCWNWILYFFFSPSFKTVRPRLLGKLASDQQMLKRHVTFWHHLEGLWSSSISGGLLTFLPSRSRPVSPPFFCFNTSHMSDVEGKLCSWWSRVISGTQYS